MRVPSLSKRTARIPCVTGSLVSNLSKARAAMLACADMNRKASLFGWTLVVLIALAVGQRWLSAGLSSARNHTETETAAANLAQFPAEERQAIQDAAALLKAGGPFPYTKDGREFSNREGRLPPPGLG